MAIRRLPRDWQLRHLDQPRATRPRRRLDRADRARASSPRLVLRRVDAHGLGRAPLEHQRPPSRLPLPLRPPPLQPLDYRLPHPRTPHAHHDRPSGGPAMTLTLPGADIRGYYAALGIQLPPWAQTEASIRCFVDPDAHRRGDRDPSCSVSLEHGAWHCHGCGEKGGALDAATKTGHSDRAAIDLMVRFGITGRREETKPRRPPRPARQ